MARRGRESGAMFELTPAVATAVTDTATALLIGPPGGLPGPVPDFVGDLLGTIGSFVDGSTGALGEAVQSVTPGGETEAPLDGAGSDGGGPPA